MKRVRPSTKFEHFAVLALVVFSIVQHFTITPSETYLALNLLTNVLLNLNLVGLGSLIGVYIIACKIEFNPVADELHTLFPHISQLFAPLHTHWVITLLFTQWCIWQTLLNATIAFLHDLPHPDRNQPIPLSQFLLAPSPLRGPPVPVR